MSSGVQISVLLDYTGEIEIAVHKTDENPPIGAIRLSGLTFQSVNPEDFRALERAAHEAAEKLEKELGK